VATVARHGLLRQEAELVSRRRLLNHCSFQKVRAPDLAAMKNRSRRIVILIACEATMEKVLDKTALTFS
jgi:hypothetical protein